MRLFKGGERVIVHRSAEYDDMINAPGTVMRLRRADAGAWVHLDQRVADKHHPFPADDPHGRATSVLTYPEECELLKENA